MIADLAREHRQRALAEARPRSTRDAGADQAQQTHPPERPGYYRDRRGGAQEI